MKTIDFNEVACPVINVVEFDGVNLPLLEEYDAGMDNVSFTLRRGELAMILLEHGAWNHPLADVVSGLTCPESGTVRVFGESWQDHGPDFQAMARWKIGRVFEGHGWLSNLDIDENVTLSERHHTLRDVVDIESEMHDLVKLVGLPEFPHGRPSVADREALRRVEWVRAALGSPWLVILERPGRDLGEGWVKDLAGLVEHVLGRGAAVIWLVEDPAEIAQVSLSPTLKFIVKENTLARVGNS